MDRNGFIQAVREHKDRLHSYAAWVLHDVDEATDVTQEALVRLWQNRDRVRAPAARTWLLRTVHRLCLDRFRRRRNGSGGSLNSQAILSMPADATPTPEQWAVLQDLRVTMARALGSLSDRDRTMLLMRETQGMPYEEISDVMEMPMGTLKAALHRARQRLRRALTAAGVHP